MLDAQEEIARIMSVINGAIQEVDITNPQQNLDNTPKRRHTGSFFQNSSAFTWRRQCRAWVVRAYPRSGGGPSNQ